jgi:glycosyltransferase involved in cell wall biosynthesis
VYGHYDSDFRQSKKLMGIEVAVHSLTEALAENAEVFPLYAKGPVHHPNIHPLLPGPCPKGSPQFAELEGRLKSRFEEESFDAIILNRPNYRAFSLFQDSGDIPIILRCHGVSKQGGEFEGILGCATIARPFDAVCFPTQCIMDYASEYSIACDTFRVLPNGVDTEHFKPVDKKIAKRELFQTLNWESTDRKVVGFVSRMEAKKGFGVMIEVAKRLPDILFVFAGERSCNIDSSKFPNIRLVDSVPYLELPRYYNAFDVFCFPSLGGPETCGLVCLEAMSCNLGPIVLDNTAPAELVGDTGHKVPCKHLADTFCGLAHDVSPILLAETIQSHLDISDSDSKQAGTPRQRAKLYSWEKSAQKTLEIIEQLKAKKPPCDKNFQSRLWVRFVPEVGFIKRDTGIKCVINDPFRNHQVEYAHTVDWRIGLTVNLMINGHTNTEIQILLNEICGESTQSIIDNSVAFLRAYNTAHMNIQESMVE